MIKTFKQTGEGKRLQAGKLDQRSNTGFPEENSNMLQNTVYSLIGAVHSLIGAVKCTPFVLCNCVCLLTRLTDNYHEIGA